ncbi:MAG: hypothetical protein QXV17_07605 [Candidatus Micrarchaeaceae archaeon]
MTTNTKKHGSNYYKSIAIGKKQNPSISLRGIAKKYGYKQSDFVNRKAYLNTLARRAGYKNYYAWLEARRALDTIKIDIKKKPEKVNFEKLYKQFENKVKEKKKLKKFSDVIYQFTSLVIMYNRKQDIHYDYLLNPPLNLKMNISFQNLESEMQIHIDYIDYIYWVELKLITNQQELIEKFENPEEAF